MKNDEGIWAQDIDGTLRLILRKGDLLDVDNGPGIDLRTVDGLAASLNYEEGFDFAKSFNDRGEFALYASFPGFSQGVFVSNLVAVPEPVDLPPVGALLATWLLMLREIIRIRKDYFTPNPNTLGIVCEGMPSPMSRIGSRI